MDSYEHYQEAERLLEQAKKAADERTFNRSIALAQLHATMAAANVD